MSIKQNLNKVIAAIGQDVKEILARLTALEIKSSATQSDLPALTVLTQDANTVAKFQNMATKDIKLQFADNVYVEAKQYFPVRYRFAVDEMTIQLKAYDARYIENSQHSITLERLTALPSGCIEPDLHLTSDDNTGGELSISASPGEVMVSIYSNLNTTLTLSHPLIENTLKLTIVADPEHGSYHF